MNTEKRRKGWREWQRKWRRDNPLEARQRDRLKHKKRRELEKTRYKLYVRPPADPIKLAARMALNKAIRAGIVKRPEACSKCPNKRPQGHHHDYSKPLDVVWLCTKHHALEHHPLPALTRVLEIIKPQPTKDV